MQRIRKFYLKNKSLMGKSIVGCSFIFLCIFEGYSDEMKIYQVIPLPAETNPSAKTYPAATSLSFSSPMICAFWDPGKLNSEYISSHKEEVIGMLQECIAYPVCSENKQGEYNLKYAQDRLVWYKRKNMAIRILADIEELDSVPFFIQMANNEKTPVLVRRYLVFTLAELADPRAADTFIKMMYDPSLETRIYALEGLATLFAETHDQRMLTAMRQAIHDKDWLVRHKLVRLFTDIQSPEAEQILLTLCSDPHSIVREAAQKASLTRDRH